MLNLPRNERKKQLTLCKRGERKNTIKLIPSFNLYFKNNYKPKTPPVAKKKKKNQNVFTV